LHVLLELWKEFVLSITKNNWESFTILILRYRDFNYQVFNRWWQQPQNSDPQLVTGFWKTRQIEIEAFVIYWWITEWPCILQFSRSLLLNLHWLTSKHIKLLFVLFVCFNVEWSKTCATSSKIQKPFSRGCNTGKRQLNGRQFVVVVVVVA